MRTNALGDWQLAFLGDVTDAAVEPPEPFVPVTTLLEWECFADFPNLWAAYIVAGLLENEGVPTYIDSNSVFSYATVFVPKPLAHRARWILALQPPTEAELIFLATGELPS